MPSKTISFFLLLIINIKLIITELSNDFQYGDLLDTGDMINITDYYNLSILVSTSKKNIYRVSSNNKEHNYFSNYQI